MKYMMLLLLVISVSAFGQVDMEKDTIQLNELVITKYSKSYKLKSESLRGPCYSSDNLNDAAEVLTLVDKLPEGEINLVRFYFNEMFEAYKRSPENFQDKDFELLLYTVGDDNMPAKPLVTGTMILRLQKYHAGGVEINISALNIKNPKKLFVGLKLLGKREKNDFVIDCLCNGHDKYLTLFRTPGSTLWERRWACAALKVDMSVAVKK